MIYLYYMCAQVRFGDECVYLLKLLYTLWVSVCLCLCVHASFWSVHCTLDLVGVVLHNCTFLSTPCFKLALSKWPIGSLFSCFPDHCMFTVMHWVPCILPEGRPFMHSVHTSPLPLLSLQNLGFIVTGIGLVTNVIFHIGVPEPKHGTHAAVQAPADTGYGAICPHDAEALDQSIEQSIMAKARRRTLCQWFTDIRFYQVTHLLVGMSLGCLSLLFWGKGVVAWWGYSGAHLSSCCGASHCLTVFILVSIPPMCYCSSMYKPPVIQPKVQMAGYS